MASSVVVTCPACESRMAITELTCPECNTRVQGVFAGPGLLGLNKEQLQFVEVFVRNRGNIREVERDLKISYPTVRSRLDQVIAAMGYPTNVKAEESDEYIGETLDGLGNGTITFEEALQIMKGRSGNK